MAATVTINFQNKHNFQMNISSLKKVAESNECHKRISLLSMHTKYERTSTKLFSSLPLATFLKIVSSDFAASL